MCFPLSASTRLGFRKNTLHLINLCFHLSSYVLLKLYKITAQSNCPGSMCVLHVQQNINGPCGCMLGTDKTNNCMKQAGQSG